MVKILIFVPTYNCERQISNVVNKLCNLNYNAKALKLEFIILDNNSQDKTVESAITAAKQFPGKAIRIAVNKANYGLGGSHKVAFDLFLDSDHEILIIYHGDDQVDIKDLEKLFDLVQTSTFDCLLGARFMPKSKRQGYSIVRTFGNYAFLILYSIRFRHFVWDMGSGLNAYKKTFFGKFNVIELQSSMPDDLTFNNYLLIASYIKRVELKYFEMNWSEQGQVSNAKLLEQSLLILKGIIESITPERFIRKKRYNSSFKYKSKIVFEGKK